MMIVESRGDHGRVRHGLDPGEPVPDVAILCLGLPPLDSLRLLLLLVLSPVMSVDQGHKLSGFSGPM
jgi:hypothetical protein